MTSEEQQEATYVSSVPPSEAHEPVDHSSSRATTLDDAASNAASRAPPGFPVGPVQGDRVQLLSHVKKWTTNTSTAGGGWPVRFVGSRKATGKTGFRVRIGCGFGGHMSKTSTGCKWEVEYEDTPSGWVLAKYCTHKSDLDTQAIHNHTLAQSTAEVMAQRSGQFVPEELAVLAGQLRRLPPSVIHHILCDNAVASGLPITWTRETVAARFCNRSADPSVDMSKALEFLSQQQELHGLEFYVQTEPSAEEGCVHINRLFVELEGARLEWARCGEENVLLFDPTWGTNRYNLKLCCFITVGHTGASIILAFALIQYEDANSVLWAFKCFHDVFRIPPRTLFTDGAAAIENAFNQMQNQKRAWSNTCHFFCIFHLFKNLWTHLSPLFAHHRPEFKKLCTEFWAIAKESDHSTASMEHIREEWLGIERLVVQLPFSQKLYDEVKWLEGLRDKGQQWAQRFVCQRVTYLVYSTQR